MMDDHALHEVHFCLGAGRQLTGGSGRQPLAGFSWSARLNYYRARRITVLAQSDGWGKGGNQQAPPRYIVENSHVGSLDAVKEILTFQRLGQEGAGEILKRQKSGFLGRLAQCTSSGT